MPSRQARLHSIAIRACKSAGFRRTVAAKDEREKEVLERLVLAVFLESADGGYMVKNEDFESDLKVQVMRLKELYLKRVGGYIV